LSGPVSPATTLVRDTQKLYSSIPLQLTSADDDRAYSKPMVSNALIKGKAAAALAKVTASQQVTLLGGAIETHTHVSGIDCKA